MTGCVERHLEPRREISLRAGELLPKYA